MLRYVHTCLWIAFVWISISVPISVLAYQVAPAITEVDARAGETVEKYLTISNPDREPLHVVFTVQKFVASGGGAPSFLPPSDVTGLPEWFRLTAREMTIPPGVSEKIRVQLQIPKDAKNGGQYAAIFITKSPDGGGSVGLGSRIATLWMVRVQGEGAGVKEVAQWSVGSREVLRSMQGILPGYRAHATVRNAGSVHGVLAVKMSINGLGLHCTAHDSQTIRLLPGETRKLMSAPCFSWLPIQRVTARFEGLTEQRSLITDTWKQWVWHPTSLALWGCVLGMGASVMWRIRRRRGILKT